MILLHKYQVGRKLGEGAMGAAWLVKHLSLDLERVIKVINPSLVQDPGIRLRFSQEAKMMAKLNGHPNAVLVHDAGFDNSDSMAFIVMDYLRGAPLRKSLTPNEPKPLDWVARIVYQLCDVLQVAHSKHRIVHRDLKPENVMLLDGEPGKEVIKVLDFGIAKVIRDEADAENATNMMQTSGVLGTVAYASPEQNDFDPNTGTHAPVDGRSDLYSLGVMMYEMLTGHRPFRGNLTKLLYDHAHTPPPPFSEIEPGLNLPPEVEAVVMRCLEKKPENRFQSAAELQNAFLEAAATVLPYTQITPSYLRTPIPGFSSGEHLSDLSLPLVAEKPRRSKPRTVALSSVGLILSLALGMGVYHYWPTHIPPPPPPPIEDPLPLDPEKLAFLSNQGYVNPPRSQILEGGIPESLTRKIENGLILSYQWNPSHKVYLPQGYEVDESEGLAADGWPKVLLRHPPSGAKDQRPVRFLRIVGTPPGKPFLMGDFHPRFDGKILSHKVELDGYYLQECETSVGDILAGPLCSIPGAYPPGFQKYLSELKTSGISDAEALRYPATRLNRLDAAQHSAAFQAQLPTEAQWEYAARSRGQNHEFVAGHTDPASGWANVEKGNIDSFGIDLKPVDSDEYPLDRTEQGVRDLTGNVGEWCRDRYIREDSFPAPEAPAVTNPCELPEAGDEVVVRGGSSLDDNQPHFKTYGRHFRDYTYAEGELGFRQVLECPSRFPEGEKPSTTEAL